MTSHPLSQAKYQVRFDWGPDGAARIADGTDIVIWVDVLASADADAGRAAVAGTPALAAAEVIEGGLVDAATAAARVLAMQVELGRRTYVAVVAAGAHDPATGVRFCVEDLLGAGAIVDALAAVGIDYCSPEAAAASAAFTGLRGAVTHLATASATAQELVATGADPAGVRAAAVLSSSDELRVVRPAIS